MSDVTLLKAAHYGSRDAVSPAWLSRTKPVVVISVGGGNPHGHPHEWVMRYYRAACDTIYRTDLHEEIAIQENADGTFVVNTGRATSAPMQDQREVPAVSYGH